MMGKMAPQALQGNQGVQAIQDRTVKTELQDRTVKTGQTELQVDPQVLQGMVLLEEITIAALEL